MLKSPIFQMNTEMYKGEKYFIRKLNNFIRKQVRSGCTYKICLFLILVLQSYFGSAVPSLILTMCITLTMTLSIIGNEIILPFGYAPYINNKTIQLLYHIVAYSLALYIANLYIWLYFNTLIFIIEHFKNLQKCISCISQRSRLDFIQVKFHQQHQTKYSYHCFIFFFNI